MQNKDIGYVLKCLSCSHLSFSTFGYLKCKCRLDFKLICPYFVLEEKLIDAHSDRDYL